VTKKSRPLRRASNQMRTKQLALLSSAAPATASAGTSAGCTTDSLKLTSGGETLKAILAKRDWRSFTQVSRWISPAAPRIHSPVSSDKLTRTNGSARLSNRNPDSSNGSSLGSAGSIATCQVNRHSCTASALIKRFRGEGRSEAPLCTQSAPIECFQGKERSEAPFRLLCNQASCCVT
jgi:hypothetical protein